MFSYFYELGRLVIRFYIDNWNFVSYTWTAHKAEKENEDTN